MALTFSGRVPEAVAAFHQALAINPDDAEAFGGLAAVALDACDWKQDAEIERKLVMHVNERKSPIRPFAVLGYREEPYCCSNARRLRGQQFPGGLTAEQRHALPA